MPAILSEDGTAILQESGGKILLEAQSGYNPLILQFVSDALRTFNAGTQNLDLTMDSNRHRISTVDETLRSSGHQAVRNGDGTALTIAQIAAAANLTSAQVQDIAGRLYQTAG